MGWYECLARLARHWIERAKEPRSQPADYRLVAFIYRFGLGGVESNPAAADAWFRLAEKERELARNRAALEQREQEGVPDAGILDQAERSGYDPWMLDRAIKNHIFVSIRSGAHELRLGLTPEQKNALAVYVVSTFEGRRPQLPAVAPERYAERQVDERRGRRENIVEFLTRVYAKEIEAGIIEDADLSPLDRSAYNALHSWNSIHPNEEFHLEKAPDAFGRETNRKLEAVRYQIDHSPRHMRRLEIAGVSSPTGS